MADITTDVMVIGTGPAGSATAALLATYGITTLIINRYRWMAASTTPRFKTTWTPALMQRQPLKNNAKRFARPLPSRNMNSIATAWK